jgi:Sulfotransferase family
MIYVKRIELKTPFSDGLGTTIDMPKFGLASGAHLTLAGWFIVERELERHTEVIVLVREFRNKLISSCRASQRGDVATANEIAAGNVAAGFELRINGLDLPPHFTLEVRARTRKDGMHQEWALCWIEGVLDPSSVDNGKFRPIYITGIGRSGTTVLMRMLAQHPAIVAGDKYPLELGVSIYHARVARLTSIPANYDDYSQADLFSNKPFVGANPFASLDYVSRAVLEQAGLESWKKFRKAAVDANDAWYHALAFAAGKESVSHYLEKANPGDQLVTALNAYSDAQGVILVREPRDIFLSRMRFNSKRGSRDFGENVARDENHWVDIFLDELRALICMQAAFPDRFSAVIRYEELMLEPENALMSIFGALNLKLTAPLLDEMIVAGKDKTGSFGYHVTSSDRPTDKLRDEKKELLGRICSEIPEFYNKYGYA